MGDRGHYVFVHQLLGQWLLTQTSTAIAELRVMPARSLDRLWRLATKGSPPSPFPATVTRGTIAGRDDVYLLSFTPQAPTEAFFVALVYTAAGGARYFVLERGVDGGATPLEYKADGMGGLMRIRYEPASAPTAVALFTVITMELGALVMPPREEVSMGAAPPAASPSIGARPALAPITTATPAAASPHGIWGVLWVLCALALAVVLVAMLFEAKGPPIQSLADELRTLTLVVVGLAAVGATALYVTGRRWQAALLLVAPAALAVFLTARKDAAADAITAAYQADQRADKVRVELLARVGAICASWHGDGAAAGLRPGSGPHRIVAFVGEDRPGSYHGPSWNERLPEAWGAARLEDVELVACLTITPVNVEDCAYGTDGQVTRSRRRNHVELRVLDARSGTTLRATRLEAPEAPACEASTVYGGSDFESWVDEDDLVDALRPLVER